MYFSSILCYVLALGTLFLVTNGALTPVTNFGSNPTGLTMGIYVPTKLATNPAVILAVSSCHQPFTL